MELPSDLDSFLQKAFVDLDQLLKKVGVAQGMQHYSWKPEIEPRLSDSKFPAENWQKLKIEGFWGNILPTKRGTRAGMSLKNGRSSSGSSQT